MDFRTGRTRARRSGRRGILLDHVGKRIVICDNAYATTKYEQQHEASLCRLRARYTRSDFFLLLTVLAFDGQEKYRSRCLRAE